MNVIDYCDPEYTVIPIDLDNNEWENLSRSK